MNKIISLFLMVFLVVGTLSFVVAVDSDNGVPSAKKVGFFEDRMDRIMLAFTFNDEKRIDRALEMAEKRLAEAEILSQRNDSDNPAEENLEAYAKIQARYDELVAKAEKALADIESGADNENRSVDYMEKMARIENKFERHRSHADEVYTRALVKFQENNASDEKIARFEMFYERALNRSDDMEARIVEKRENAFREHKALTEMNDAELEDLLGKIEDREGLTQDRETREEQFNERVNRLKDKGIEQTERMEEHLENSNLSENAKERLKHRIEEANNRIEEAREKVQNRFEEQEEAREQKSDRLKNAIEDRLNDDEEGENETRKFN